MEKLGNIKSSLESQLKARGADIALYRDLIDQYLWFRQQLQKMRTDIQKRGRTYTTISAAGKEYEKNNPSVDDALKYSKQMVAILDALGLSTDTIKTESDGDDDGNL